jgi:SAM-dependent methyltransferase
MVDGSLFLKYIKYLNMDELFSNCFFAIISNKRLEYKKSYEKVEDFYIKRLKYYNVLNFKFIYQDEVNNLLIDLLNTKIKHLVVVDIMSPIIDFQVLKEALIISEKNNFLKLTTFGCVPGTEFKFILNLESIKKNGFQINVINIDSIESFVFNVQTQNKHNNQLNLYKFKRLKLFIILIERYENLFSYSIDEFLDFLYQEEIYNLMISFGENVRLLYYKNCPHCNGDFQPLYNNLSQPICGYVSSKRPHYHECEGCGLVVPSPYIHEDDIHKVYDDWDKQDFVVSVNNPFSKDSVRCDFSKFINYLPDNAHSLDLGGGVGNFSKYLSNEYPNWNITHSDFSIKSEIEGDFKCKTLDFTNNEIGNNEYDLITAWEVIEHVPYKKLNFVFQNIWNALKPGGYFVFSTPDFDSPLCKSLDFFSMGLPFHYTVLGKKWLLNYFQNKQLFEIEDIKHCSDFLDDAMNWYSYAENTSANQGLKGTYAILKTIFGNDNNKDLKNLLLNKEMGTEVIFTLKK